ncbi:hypothetical protein [Scytonema sp. NUACC26]|uniref:hypothetical protein n=1 Tax=Scytonema sp. NUACC26 TaxID=3140176 RepID=UPI0038B3796C
MAELYYQIGNLDLALENCKRAVAIATALGTPLLQDYLKLKAKLDNDASFSFKFTPP